MLAIQYMIGIYLKRKHDTIAGTSKCKTRGYKMTSDRLKIQNKLSKQKIGQLQA